MLSNEQAKSTQEWQQVIQQLQIRLEEVSQAKFALEVKLQ